MEPLLKTSQVAWLLAVSRRSIRLWAESGQLRGIKVGRQWRFRSEAVQKLLAAREPGRPEIYSPSAPMVTAKCGNNGIYGKQIPGALGYH